MKFFNLFNKKAVSAETESIKKTVFERAAERLEQSGIREYAEYMSSPWRILWTNFFAGVVRGIGLFFGLTVGVTILVWLLGQFVDFPLVGEYAQNVLTILEQADVTITPKSP